MKRILLIGLITGAAFAGANAQEATFEPNTSRFGGTYRVTPSNSAQACAEVCNREQRCLAWTYTRNVQTHVSSICELKHSVGLPERSLIHTSGLSSLGQTRAAEAALDPFDRLTERTSTEPDTPLEVPLGDVAPAPVATTLATAPPNADPLPNLPGAPISPEGLKPAAPTRSDLTALADATTAATDLPAIDAAKTEASGPPAAPSIPNEVAALPIETTLDDLPPTPSSANAPLTPPIDGVIIDKAPPRVTFAPLSHDPEGADTGPRYSVQRAAEAALQEELEAVGEAALTVPD